ncbi:MAG: hypothetical protein COS65_33550 [Armatimonadetes bacterium CG06_land_8_20_14_3_00_66_21]|nr:MAG: hypothetical protein COS65_33550 [Armatimonadetes bacterium CG06_land_8_20_14_3_00_66_21]PIX39045.1 MAG: hypothetical protein COZ57_29125 [Armatimonadetes bacterium CG_4_8_14_3_um_filter_66_20]
MDLKQAVSQIINEEWDGALEELTFEGPYEGEDLFVFVGLRHEPQDFEERNARMRHRVRDLGYDVGMVVDLVDDLVPA